MRAAKGHAGQPRWYLNFFRLVTVHPLTLRLYGAKEVTIKLKAGPEALKDS
jgi:hypothetical protein